MSVFEGLAKCQGEETERRLTRDVIKEVGGGAMEDFSGTVRGLDLFSTSCKPIEAARSSRNTTQATYVILICLVATLRKQEK